MKKKIKPSPELMKALDFLLENTSPEKETKMIDQESVLYKLFVLLNRHGSEVGLHTMMANDGDYQKVYFSVENKDGDEPIFFIDGEAIKEAKHLYL